MIDDGGTGRHQLMQKVHLAFGQMRLKKKTVGRIIHTLKNYKIVFSHVSGSKNGNVILFCMKSILRNRDSILYKL
jgi:hypothetical protein